MTASYPNTTSGDTSFAIGRGRSQPSPFGPQRWMGATVKNGSPAPGSCIFRIVSHMTSIWMV